MYTDMCFIYVHMDATIPSYNCILKQDICSSYTMLLYFCMSGESVMAIFAT